MKHAVINNVMVERETLYVSLKIMPQTRESLFTSFGKHEVAIKVDY